MPCRGSCHCGSVAFAFEGRIDPVIDCDCSMCQRRCLEDVDLESLRVVEHDGRSKP